MRLNRACFSDLTEGGFRDSLAAGIRNQRETCATGKPARMMEEFLAKRAVRKGA